MIKIVFENKEKETKRHHHSVVLYTPVKSWDGKSVKIERKEKYYMLTDAAWDLLLLKIKHDYQEVREYSDRVEVYTTLTLESEEKEAKKK